MSHGPIGATVFIKAASRYIDAGFLVQKTGMKLIYYYDPSYATSP